MNFSAHLTAIQGRLETQGFTAVAGLPAELQPSLPVVVARSEGWGRLILAVATPSAAADPERRQWLVQQLAQLCQQQSESGDGKSIQAIVAFPFPGGLPDEQIPAIRALRLDGPEQRWGVLPWSLDLAAGLADRHKGFPRVPDAVQVALVTPPVAPTGVAPEFRRSALTRMLSDWSRGEFGPAPATRLLLSATVAYYIWSVLMDPTGPDLVGGPSMESGLRWGANLSPLVMAGENWRLLTAVFLHWGLWHLGLNMWALWNLGQHVELLYGSRQMGVIYLLAGLTGSLASTWLNHRLAASAGASGAIFGLLGAIAYVQLTTGARRIDWRGILMPLGFSFLYGLALNIDHFGHFGGLIGGFCAGWLVGATGQRAPWRRYAVWGALAAAGLLVAGVIPAG